MGSRPLHAVSPASATGRRPAPSRSLRGPADPAALNRTWLAAYACSSEAHVRLHWRNALAEANLPLVRQQAARMAHGSDLPLDDLVQLGAIGLLRAIEAYDASRCARLSSFAVPYIRGAMLHHLRDQHRPLRAPRRLRELQRQGEELQNQRRHAGLPPLAREALAERLGCGLERLEEAAGLRQAERVRSLDAPAGSEDPEAGEATLLDTLAAAPPPQEAPARIPAPLAWLRQRLAQLPEPERLLLEGRYQLGATWVELGEQLGMHPRLAQRRGEALLARLRAEAEEAGPTLTGA
ncbi:MAG: sigma-70 family RNA polymerase sigma factor [Synechococcus sp.]|nr:sigma-70 family RNA polymerase sigma factor [Synechococcus sp.]